MLAYKRLIDISQPVKSDSAAFPGDTPFKREIVLTYEESKIVNLSAFSMSPHVGTHVDAPSHIKGDMHALTDMVGQVSLEALIGPALVLDLSPSSAGLDWQPVEKKLAELSAGKQDWKIPPRVLFKTQQKIRYEVFEDEYSFFSTELVKELAARGVQVMGIDTPSADHVRSKTLEAHHELDSHGMTWLENLDLSNVVQGEYYLIAFPIKFMELEASPVRAVLLQF